MLANIADNTASQSFWVGALLLVRNRYIIPTIKAASRVSLKSIMNSFIIIKLSINKFNDNDSHYYFNKRYRQRYKLI